MNNINNINNPIHSSKDTFQQNSIQLNEFNNIFNKTNIQLILQEWFNYKLFNKTDNLIHEANNLIFKIDNLISELDILIDEVNKLIIDVNNLLLEAFSLLNFTKDTINIYYNIGDFILTNISLTFYIIIICSILAICIQIIICILLYFIYKDNKNIKIQRNNKNKKQNYITYFI